MMINAMIKQYHEGWTITEVGIGIPESGQYDLFERFAQVDSSDTRSKGGAGLGVAISN